MLYVLLYFHVISDHKVILQTRVCRMCTLLVNLKSPCEQEQVVQVFSLILLVEVENCKLKYGDFLCSFKLCDGGRKKNIARTLRRVGQRARAHDTCVNGLPKSGLSPCEGVGSFCSFFFW